MSKILVIEDEFDIRYEIISWLEFEDYQVLDAENGRQGLALIYQERPDLVLCDISMPEMNGHEVLMDVRSNEEFINMPFIFTTAAADRDSVREGMNLGADDYITKPFTHHEVISAIRSQLSKNSQMRVQVERLQVLLDDERSQRLLKSRLIGMFSHDFRNPLSTILSASGLLQNYYERMTPADRLARFQKIDGSVLLLLQMLDEMLLVAEVENNKVIYNPNPTDVKKLISKVVDEFRLIDNNKHTILLNCEITDLVNQDPHLLRHIIANLVSNAIKYSDSGTEISLQCSLNNNQLLFTITDQGIGISNTDIGQLFEPFFRAKNVQGYKGTGLGLSLVKEAVEVCGGSIEVESEINKGTRFSVCLPA